MVRLVAQADLQSASSGLSGRLDRARRPARGQRLQDREAAGERATSHRTRAWIANIAAIAGWSKLFFGRRRLGPSEVAAGTMVPLGAAYVAASARVDKPAAVQAASYVGWLVFASVLSTTIWMLNRNE